MNEYETEEQQIEALKKWLKENGASILLGLGLGILALGGWRYYINQRNNHASQASNIYMQAAQHIMIKGVDDKVIDVNNQLNDKYENTPYAALLSMLMASNEYKKGDLDDAVSQLKWAVKHATNDEIKQLARLRLSRILIGNKQYDKAMSYLNQQHGASYDALYAELKGDVYAAKGQLAEARKAYDKAISLSGKTNKGLLLKRQSLGEIDKHDNVALL